MTTQTKQYDKETAMTALQLAAALGNTRNMPPSAIFGKCPAHPDNNPSLHITDSDDGKLLLNCMAGCEQSDVISAIKDMGLWNGSDHKNETTAKKYDSPPPWKRPVEAVYDYFDENGNLQYSNVKFSDGLKPRFMMKNQKGNFGQKGIDSILFNLPNVIKAKMGIFIVEGEKDVLNLGRLGFTATTSGGANSWRDSYNKYFQDKNVCIIPDNDAAGKKYAEQVTRRLIQVAKSVRILNLPGLPEKGDVSDWIEAGGTEREMKDLAEVTEIESKITPKSNEVEGEEWPDIVPFEDYSNLPKFPADMLPGIGREMVESVSKSSQVDTGLVGTLYLGVLATALQGKLEVSLGTHTETLSLFVSSVLPSGERKSNAFKEMTRPVYEHQKEKANEMAPEIRKSDTDRRTLESRLAGQMKIASKIKATEIVLEKAKREAQEIADELAETPVLKAPVYVVDDITPESLGILMSENGDRISIMSSEGDIFSIVGGRYSSGAVNIALCLKAHSGDPYSCNRVGRKSYSMDKPALTFCITLQPEVVSEIGQNKAFRGQGLLARILYSVDTPQAGYRKRIKIEIPPDLRENYSKHIKDLIDFAPQPSSVLNLTSDASQVWDDFYNEVEISMRPGGQLENMKDWGSKLAGAVARIAGLLHCAKCGINSTDKDISVETTINAVLIGRYYLSHALAAFGIMKQDPQIESAKKILEYLIDKKPVTFKGCDVLWNKNHFKKIDEVNEALVPLLERHYIREIPRSPANNGRPSAPKYQVNVKI